MLIFLSILIFGSEAYKLSLFSSRTFSKSQLQATTTYIPIDIGKKNTLLVKSDQNDIIDEVKCWGKSFDESKVLIWKNEGKAFLLDEEGTSTLALTEKGNTEKLNVIKKPKISLGDIDMYVDVAPKRSKSPHLIKLNKIDDIVSGKRDFKDMEQRGDGFKNLTELFIDHSVSSRANNIGQRISNEFPVSSPEWRRYTNKTIQYNVTSLTQVK
jgi:hypothetical protein